MTSRQSSPTNLMAMLIAEGRECCNANCGMSRKMPLAEGREL